MAVQVCRTYLVSQKTLHAGIKMLSTTSPYNSSKSIVQKEEQYSAPNYHPLPIVISKGQGKTLS